jgi:hypothetical protein
MAAYEGFRKKYMEYGGDRKTEKQIDRYLVKEKKDFLG